VGISDADGCSQGYQETPPRSQTDVTARVTLQSVHDPVKGVIVETNQVRPGLYVGRTLLPPKHRDVKVCVVNTTTQSVDYPRKLFRARRNRDPSDR